MATLSALGCSPESELFVSHCWAFSARGSPRFLQVEVAKLEISLRSGWGLCCCSHEKLAATGAVLHLPSSPCLRSKQALMCSSQEEPSLLIVLLLVPTAAQPAKWVYLLCVGPKDQSNPTCALGCSTPRVDSTRFSLFFWVLLQEHRFWTWSLLFFLPDSFWTFFHLECPSLSANIQLVFIESYLTYRCVFDVSMGMVNCHTLPSFFLSFSIVSFNILLLLS